MSFNNIYEELLGLYEAKEDQERFINKFGQDRFDRFNRLKSKLANVKDDAGNKVSTDITYHVKHTSDKDLDALLDRAEGKQYVAGAVTEYDVEGNIIPPPANTKKLIARNNKYDIYKVTDYTDAIDLARKKIKPYESAYGYWCIAGRYSLSNDDSVKVSQAKEYFNQYLKTPYCAYYFCMPRDHADNKVVVCAYKNKENVFTAFNSLDEELLYEDIPQECLEFTDPDTGFTPESYEASEHWDEEENIYHALGEYFMDYPHDPCRGLMYRLTAEFPAFQIVPNIVVQGDIRYCQVNIWLHPDYYDNCAVEAELRWAISEDDNPISIFTRIFTSDYTIYDQEIDGPDLEMFNVELAKVYNALQNIYIIKQAISIVESHAKAVGSEFEVNPINDENIQTLATYSIPVNNNITASVTVNVGFDPGENILDIAKEAEAFAFCYVNLVGPDGVDLGEDEDLYDSGTETATAAKLQNLVMQQIEQAEKAIKDYAAKHK